MLVDFFKQHKLICIIGVAAVAVVIVAVVLWSVLPFRFVGASDVYTTSPYIDLSFNKAASLDGADVSVNGTRITGLSLRDDGATVRLDVSGQAVLAADDATAAVAITFLRAADGQTLKNYTTTVKVVSGGPPQDSAQFDEAMRAQQAAHQTMNDQVAEKYPIAAYLPYHVYGKYEITAWAPSGGGDSHVGLTVYAYAPADTARVDQALLAQYTAQIDDWLRGKGLDPDDYYLYYHY